jgi:hypothetical protein
MSETKPISADVIEVSVKYGDRYTAAMREISMAEEQKLRSKSAGLSDEEAAQKEYDHNVRIIADLTGGEMKISRDDSAETVDPMAFFAGRTPRKERIAFFMVRGYFLRLLPEEPF